MWPNWNDKSLAKQLQPEQDFRNGISDVLNWQSGNLALGGVLEQLASAHANPSTRQPTATARGPGPPEPHLQVAPRGGAGGDWHPT